LNQIPVSQNDQRSTINDQRISDILGASRTAATSTRAPIAAGDISEEAKGLLEASIQTLAQQYQGLAQEFIEAINQRVAFGRQMTKAAQLSGDKGNETLLLTSRYKPFAEVGHRYYDGLKVLIGLHILHEAVEYKLAEGKPLASEFNREMAAVIAQARAYRALEDKSALEAIAEELDRDNPDAPYKEVLLDYQKEDFEQTAADLVKKYPPYKDGKGPTFQENDTSKGGTGGEYDQDIVAAHLAKVDEWLPPITEPPALGALYEERPAGEREDPYGQEPSNSLEAFDQLYDLLTVAEGAVENKVAPNSDIKEVASKVYTYDDPRLVKVEFVKNKKSPIRVIRIYAEGRMELPVVSIIYRGIGATITNELCINYEGQSKMIIGDQEIAGTGVSKVRFDEKTGFVSIELEPGFYENSYKTHPKYSESANDGVPGLLEIVKKGQSSLRKTSDNPDLEKLLEPVDDKKFEEILSELQELLDTYAGSPREDALKEVLKETITVGIYATNLDIVRFSKRGLKEPVVVKRPVFGKGNSRSGYMYMRLIISNQLIEEPVSLLRAVYRYIKEYTSLPSTTRFSRLEFDKDRLRKVIRKWKKSARRAVDWLQGPWTRQESEVDILCSQNKDGDALTVLAKTKASKGWEIFVYDSKTEYATIAFEIVFGGRTRMTLKVWPVGEEEPMTAKIREIEGQPLVDVSYDQENNKLTIVVTEYVAMQLRSVFDGQTSRGTFSWEILSEEQWKERQKAEDNNDDDPTDPAAKAAQNPLDPDVLKALAEEIKSNLATEIPAAVFPQVEEAMRAKNAEVDAEIERRRNAVDAIPTLRDAFEFLVQRKGTPFDQWEITAGRQKIPISIVEYVRVSPEELRRDTANGLRIFKGMVTIRLTIPDGQAEGVLIINIDKRCEDPLLLLSAFREMAPLTDEMAAEVDKRIEEFRRRGAVENADYSDLMKQARAFVDQLDLNSPEDRDRDVYEISLDANGAGVITNRECGALPAGGVQTHDIDTMDPALWLAEVRDIIAERFPSKVLERVDRSISERLEYLTTERDKRDADIQRGRNAAVSSSPATSELVLQAAAEVLEMTFMESESLFDVHWVVVPSEDGTEVVLEKRQGERVLQDELKTYEMKERKDPVKWLGELAEIVSDEIPNEVLVDGGMEELNRMIAEFERLEVEDDPADPTGSTNPTDSTDTKAPTVADAIEYLTQGEFYVKAAKSGTGFRKKRVRIKKVSDDEFEIAIGRNMKGFFPVPKTAHTFLEKFLSTMTTVCSPGSRGDPQLYLVEEDEMRAKIEEFRQQKRRADAEEGFGISTGWMLAIGIGGMVLFGGISLAMLITQLVTTEASLMEFMISEKFGHNFKRMSYKIFTQTVQAHVSNPRRAHKILGFWLITIREHEKMQGKELHFVDMNKMIFVLMDKTLSYLDDVIDAYLKGDLDKEVEMVVVDMEFVENEDVVSEEEFGVTTDVTSTMLPFILSHLPEIIAALMLLSLAKIDPVGPVGAAGGPDDPNRFEFDSEAGKWAIKYIIEVLNNSPGDDSALTGNLELLKMAIKIHPGISHFYQEARRIVTRILSEANVRAKKVELDKVCGIIDKVRNGMSFEDAFESEYPDEPRGDTYATVVPLIAYIIVVSILIWMARKRLFTMRVRDRILYGLIVLVGLIVLSIYTIKSSQRSQPTEGPIGDQNTQEGRDDELSGPGISSGEDEEGVRVDIPVEEGDESQQTQPADISHQTVSVRFIVDHVLYGDLLLAAKGRLRGPIPNYGEVSKTIEGSAKPR